MAYLLAVLAVVVAVAFIFGYYFFRKDALYVLGIGAAVSSNVYNVNAYSIDAGWLIFGLDAVIYILFVFCVMVACKDYGKKVAKAIMFSSMAGIMLTATFDFFAKWATNARSVALPVTLDAPVTTTALVLGRSNSSNCS